MINVLESGRAPRADDFGGFANLLENAAEAAKSPFAGDFVELAVESGDLESETVCDFIAAIVDNVSDDIAIVEIVDTLECAPAFSPKRDEHLFNRWITLAREKTVSANGRAASLRGAFVFKRRVSRRALALASEIANSDPADDPFYLAHAACIGGFLYAEQEHPAFFEFLDAIAQIEGAADQALFELGIAKLGAALNASQAKDVRATLAEAKHLFDAACERRETRWDAKVFSAAINILEGFYEKQSASHMRAQIESLRSDAFALSSYVFGQNKNIILRSRSAQIATWTSLAVRLEALAGSIEEDIWLEGARIIEEELLAAYTANRTILGRGTSGGVEFLIQPRIEAAVLAHNGQMLLLRSWLERNGEAELGEAAKELISAVDDEIEGNSPPDPRLAAIGGPPLAAALPPGRKDLAKVCAAAWTAIHAISQIEQDKLSFEIINCMNLVDQSFSGLDDFSIPEKRGFFLALVLKTLLFIEHRLDATAAQDPTGSYLFEQPSREKALEKQLQQDYLRFLRTTKLGTADEVRGCANGRADISHEYDRVRLITEVKRELVDSSFENLIAHYGEQTAMYQATNVRLGMLLVLDLTPNQSVGPHISTLCRPFVGDLTKDGTDRGVLIIRLPGNRIPPSEATRTASARRKRSSEAGSKQPVVAPDGSTSTRGMMSISTRRSTLP